MDKIRTALYVTKVEFIDQDKLVYVEVVNWHPEEYIQVPIDVIPEAILSKLQIGSILFANINPLAATYEELEYSDFELAPDHNFKW